jgi:uncharacterized protein YoxC
MSIKGPEKGHSTPLQPPPESSATDESTSSERQVQGEVIYLERFAKTFEASARRWEMIVYPSMFAFIILAVYGFYLVYSLTRDMHTLAESMDPHMQPHMDVLAVNVAQLATSIDIMSKQVTLMTQGVQRMDSTMTSMNVNLTAMREDLSNISNNMNTMEPLLVNLSEINTSVHGMNQSIVSMTVTLNKMSRDVGAATHQFVRPMSAINSFLPW